MKIIKILLIFLFLSISAVSAEHEQRTSVPEISIENGESFEVYSDEMGSIDSIELEIRHDDETDPWGSDVEIENEDLQNVDEETLSEEDGLIEAELDGSMELFESDIDVYAEADTDILVSGITLIGSQRFQEVEYAEEEGTGIAETFHPELALSVQHPDDQDLEYTFYNIDDESELGETYSFTTCGQDGRHGPEQEDCNEEYQGSSLEGNVEIVGGDSGVQEWEVPFTGRYNLTAVGAQGGGPHGGEGALINTELALEQGDRLRIVSAQQGNLFDQTFTAGSGASFVARVVEDGYQMFDGEEVEPILIAGGGAGSTRANENQDANLGECGRDATHQTGASGETGDGGCGGDGGEGANSVSSGAGLLGDGHHSGTVEEDPLAYIGSSRGGVADSQGGFGGGGGSREVIWDRAGGGGGYSGGGAARGGNNEWAAGGGGGSYITNDPRYDIEVLNEEVSSTGQGIVEIEIEGSPERIIGDDSVESGEAAEVEWSDRDNFEEYSWAVEVCTEGSEECVLNTNPWNFAVEIEDPEFDLEFEDYTTEHAFDVVTEIEFGRDAYEPRCDFNFTNTRNGEHYEIEDVEVEPISGTDREAVCEAKVYDESHEDFGGELFENYDVLDDIEVGVNVTDEDVGHKYLEDERQIPNQPPELVSESPADGSIVTEDEIELSVTPRDQDDEDITVYIYETAEAGQNSDTLLYSETVNDFDQVSFDDWGDLAPGEDYTWSVAFDDTHENSTFEFDFLRLTSESYRVEKTLEYDYTTLLLMEEENTDFVFSVQNRIDATQESLRTYVEGPNARFMDSGEEVKEYDMGPGEERQFHIELEPEQTGDKELKLVTEDQVTGVNTTESVPVTVREFPEAYDPYRVPGISVLQVLFLALAATGLYSVRL